MTDASRVVAVVLAAGTGTRFGGGKMAALLDGRPLPAHVLAAVRAAGLTRVVVVLGRDAPTVAAALSPAQLTTQPAARAPIAQAAQPAFDPAGQTVRSIKSEAQPIKSSPS